MANTNRDMLMDAGAGFLLGELADVACQSLAQDQLASPSDLADEILGELGASLGIDARICESIANNIRKNFNKSWSGLTEAEWQAFKSQFPESADYLSEAIH